MIEKLLKIHKLSSNHKELLIKEDICGCFYCVSIFSPKLITDWIEDENDLTAICPYCGIDSIIPNHSDYQLNKELLEEMRKHFF
ncbi:cytoplasmic protein [Brachyspira intermedia]|uniref:cytoplasmic protein n=1 Tax=Brachyspira intermedia TaxID=84377 RepID=UPI003004CEA1